MRVLLIFCFVTLFIKANSQSGDPEQKRILKAIKNLNVKVLNKKYEWERIPDGDNGDTTVKFTVKNAFDLPFKHYITFETNVQNEYSKDVKINIYCNSKEFANVKFNNTYLNELYTDKVKNFYCKTILPTTLDVTRILFFFKEDNFGESMTFDYCKLEEMKRVYSDCTKDKLSKGEYMKLEKIRFLNLSE